MFFGRKPRRTKVTKLFYESTSSNPQSTEFWEFQRMHVLERNRALRCEAGNAWDCCRTHSDLIVTLYQLETVWLSWCSCPRVTRFKSCIGIIQFEVFPCAKKLYSRTWKHAIWLRNILLRTRDWKSNPRSALMKWECKDWAHFSGKLQ